MKKKFTVMIIAFAMIIGTTGVSFAGTKGAINLKLHFADLYKIFNFITGGNQGANPDEDTDKDQDKDDNNSNDNIISGNSQQAVQVLNLVNKERSKVGLTDLTLNNKLNNVAQLKAEDMAKNGYFSHNSPTYGSAFDMMKKYGISYISAGENIAKGQKSAESVMKAWMASSGHKANILKKEYKELGVGYAADKKGNTYWVQMFIS